MVGLAAIGVGAWAAYGFLTTGPQPAEALPADTLGYVSIDLDPSGGQKIEALRTLNKFPAFEDEVGIDTDDDIRKAIFDKIQEEAQCDGLDYADDIEPWLGDRAAVAAVDLGGEAPDPVVVLQVKDADAAEKGLAAIEDCSPGDDETEVGWTIEGDWAVIAETDDIAEKVADATKKGSLADDDDFKKWTDEAGDPGVVTLYAGPGRGRLLRRPRRRHVRLPVRRDGRRLRLPMELPCETEPDDTAPTTRPMAATVPDRRSPRTSSRQLRDFEGMAATIRFDDGAIELEAAGDGNVGRVGSRPDGTSDVVGSLPSDTGAVLGLGFADGWFGDLVDYVAPYTGRRRRAAWTDALRGERAGPARRRRDPGG